ncbi:pyridoxal-phosphate dependent enzyme [Clostridium tertium]|uniref:1-aminocyclopropane-1-carboxylate deaminase/D-cysteine desulfhydrase n=1 Tax=Clostridium tertium TaxID=1559 RepID=UPI00232F2CCC|nr:pyridoxal-phosphate dependent enzyme [Clostridium tertium]MDB1944577.1 pyridoxal-phosphate dependent enzyme [Clostridium tertium]MDB1951844.1 pyridoxal-phosphate dependent enzyme [Clostridium tertium]
MGGLSSIQSLVYTDGNNKFYMKRDDLLPFSFGGNKVRIAEKYFNDMEIKKCNCIITYGSSQSNLCRVIANMAKQKNIDCYVVSPVDESEKKNTNNAILVSLSEANIIKCSKNNVANTINDLIKNLKKLGKKPYYIYGDIYGKGNEIVPMYAYFEAYEEIKEYEKQHSVKFDYIFHASGTGTTQSGLISGMLKNNDMKKIIGISIARLEEQQKKNIFDNVTLFTGIKNKELIDNSINFQDKYICGGYGKYNEEIVNIVRWVLTSDAIPLDLTYTGKAFWGMNEYLKENEVIGKNILFIHTGGLPIFFDNLDILNIK